MKYVIWGAGHRGEIIYKILGDKYVSCFIDSNKEKQAKGFCGKTVISYEQYKNSHQNEAVIVSPVLSRDIATQLDDDSVPYFFLDECPSEFMGYGIQTAQKYFEKIFNFIENHVAFYGVSIYSLWLYDNLKALGKNDITFIVQENINQNILAKLQNEYSDIKISSIEEAQKESRKIYVCFYDDKINGDSNYIDIFDLSKNIVPYKNERIATLKNFYAGKRCFIVATGPSLRVDDLEILQKNGEFCISMNSIFNAFEKTTWRPDIYAILDGMAMDKWKDEILCLASQNVKKIFIGDSCIHIDYENLSEKYFLYHTLAGKYFLTHPKVAEDFSEKNYNACTITYICMQLAVYLGFQEIYLLGVDFNYTAGNQNHFVKEKNEHVMTQSFIDESTKYVLQGYKTMKKYADTHGIKIYNATRGGALEVFARVDFDSLFDISVAHNVECENNGGGARYSRITFVVFARRKKRVFQTIRRVAASSGSVSVRSAA